MLENKQKKTVLVLAIISLVLCFVTAIPFGVNSISNLEYTVKYVVIGIAILVISIYNLIYRYQYLNTKDKFMMMTTTVPMLSYLLAISFTTILAMIRTVSVFSVEKTLVLVTVYAIVFVCVLVYEMSVDKMFVKSKKIALVLMDIVTYAVAAATVIGGAMIFNKYVGVALEASSVIYLIVSVVLCVIFGAMHISVLIKTYKANIAIQEIDAKEVVNNFYKYRNNLCARAELEIIYSLHNYTKSIIESMTEGQEEEVEVVEPQEVVEVEKTVEVPVEVEKIVERIVEVEKIVEVPVSDDEELKAKLQELEEENKKLISEQEEIIEERKRLAQLEKDLIEKEENLDKERKEMSDREYTLSEATKAVLEAKAAAETAKASAERALAAAEAAREASDGRDKYEQESEEYRRRLEEAYVEKQRLAEEAAEKEAIEREAARIAAEKEATEEELAKMAAEKEAIEAEKARIAAELELKNAPKPVRERVQKVLVPSYQDLIKYGKTIPNIEVREMKPNVHRFFKDKKLFLITQGTYNDYRMIFLCELDEAIQLIVQSPRDFEKATSPKGENWFKFIYRGDTEKYSEGYIYDIIDRSLEMLNILEQRRLEQIAEAKRLKQEARVREKQKQKEIAQKVNEAKKLKAELEKTPEERAQQEADNEAAAMQAAEKARLAEERARQKEEKARQKEEADKAKAKAAEEKQKEKERLAKQKEAEKAKAKAAAEKQKEKERLAKQKEAEKAKAKAAAEKQKQAENKNEEAA